MDDRNLLELAAQAAGIDVRWHEPWECFVHVGEWYEGRPLMHKAQMMWTPLTDDGDALRLAAKLGLCVGESVHGGQWCAQHNSLDRIIYEKGEPCAATRRAIVRCAAEFPPRSNHG
jgi:hypothetical protein